MHGENLKFIISMLLDTFTNLNNLLYFFTQQMYIFRNSFLVPHVFMECLLLLISVPILLVATPLPISLASLTTSGACSH